MTQTTPAVPNNSTVSFGPPSPPAFHRAAHIAGAVRLAELGSATLGWFWPQRIPLGRVTLLAGDPGIGKSLLTLDIAARATRGIPWPDSAKGDGAVGKGEDSTACLPPSALHLPPSSVLLLTAEDDLADTILPRLAALGADLSKIVAIPAVPGHHVEPMASYPPYGTGADDTKPLRNRAFELRRDLVRLDQLLRAMPDCRLVVIDPISAYLGDVNEQANGEVRGLMAPLAALAQQHSVAILAVTHLRKKEGAAIYRAMGSLAFVAAARAAWLVAKDPRSAHRRLLLPIKNNLAPDVAGLAFTIEQGAPMNQPIIHWSAEPIPVSAETIVGSARPSGRPDHEREDAIEWLQRRLTSGPAPASDIQEEADAHGITFGTLRRAFRELRGEAIRDGFGPFGQWMWKLPGARCPTSHIDAQK